MIRITRGQRKKRAYSVGIISLMLIFIMSCMKWLIEGIIDKPIIEVFICLSVLLFYCVNRGMKIQKISIVWTLYMINIIVSLAIHQSTIGLWGRGAVTVLTTALILFINEPVEKYSSVIKMITYTGLINAGLVVIHFITKAVFNQFYISILNEKAAATAQLYMRSGYYFGLLYNPHEPAGLIAFAIVSLIIWNMITKAHKISIYVLCMAMLIPILMTGKKAVLICSLIAFAITILVLYGSRKQFTRSIAFIFALILLIVLFYNIVIRHPEIDVFNRFGNFFNRLISQESVDSGRILLYQRAISEWNDHKIWGIGWRHFNALTVNKFNMTQSHEVNCDYLQWLCETGIVGFVLSIIPVVIMLFRTMRVTRRQLRRFGKIYSNKIQWVILMACYIQFYTLIYAFVEIPFFDIVFFTIYIISCIVINSTYSRRSVQYE